MSLDVGQQSESPPICVSRKFSVDDVGFFEGTEKLLEVWFSFSDIEGTHHRGLREIPKSLWVELLQLAQCQILSECSNETMDAYLLSESSMYISKNRFILKTCGTTNLMSTVQPLFDIVKKEFADVEIRDFFYSHRNFLKPDLQVHPHHSFTDESKYLDTIFKDGAAYVLGRLNGNCWYLYLVECIRCPLPSPDQTLEILMTNMDPDFMGQFSKAAFTSADELTKAIGLSDLLPGSILDAHVFDPCGYSLNAIVKDDVYFTVHVTPQQECSYVSFETNYISESYTNLITKLLKIFQPGSFTLTLFANKAAKCGSSYTAIKDEIFPNYICQDKQLSIFTLYDLTFVRYVHNSLNTTAKDIAFL